MSNKIYLVGGSLRDLLMGKKSKDKDYVVECSFEELKDLCIGYGYTILHEKPEFLTLRVRIPSKEVVDFVCCREEHDYDGRRPSKVSTSNIQADLGRRDFTVNAIAVEVDPTTFEPIGDFIDPYGGQEDIKSSSLRFVGDPLLRLEEDGLRWLRAIRFWITKDLTPTKETKDHLYHPPQEVLDKVSVERIREELEKCFKHDTELTLTILNMVPNYWLKGGIWLKPVLEEK